MNTVAKGNRNQRRSRRLLENEGWECYTARRGYQGQEIDIFGLFDIIAYREGYFLLVQVKSNKCSKKVREAIRRFETDGHFVKRVIHIWKDYQRVPIIIELLSA